VASSNESRSLKNEGVRGGFSSKKKGVLPGGNPQLQDGEEGKNMFLLREVRVGLSAWRSLRGPKEKERRKSRRKSKRNYVGKVSTHARYQSPSRKFEEGTGRQRSKKFCTDHPRKRRHSGSSYFRRKKSGIGEMLEKRRLRNNPMKGKFFGNPSTRNSWGYKNQLLMERRES